MGKQGTRKKIRVKTNRIANIQTAVLVFLHGCGRR
jgi:hypothetical protein